MPFITFLFLFLFLETHVNKSDLFVMYKQNLTHFAAWETTQMKFSASWKETDPWFGHFDLNRRQLTDFMARRGNFTNIAKFQHKAIQGVL